MNAKLAPQTLTLGDDRTLVELAVAANEDLAEVPVDHGQDLVQNLRGSLGAGSVAGPIDGAERLIGFCQCSQKRMIGPLAIIGEVSPLLAFAIDFFNGRVQINGRDLLARSRHPAPHLFTGSVDHTLECLKVTLIKASEEIAGCGGIGNPAGFCHAMADVPSTTVYRGLKAFPMRESTDTRLFWA